MPARIRLLVIDPQNDFCDGPANGALPVPGAFDDLTRLAAMVDRLGGKIDDIDVTLDSHHTIDIAHPAWWIDSTGMPPPPYTQISVRDVETGVWSPRNPKWKTWSLFYVRELARMGKYDLRIWPVHCLIGSVGHAIHPGLQSALRRWEEREFAMVNFVTKGSNPFTEHYSAVSAEVPDPEDPSTLLNGNLIDALKTSDKILVAGQALSHCVRTTVLDIAQNIGEEHVRKFVFLEDASSPVPLIGNGPDFPMIGQQFIRDMQARGMLVSTTTSFLAN